MRLLGLAAISALVICCDAFVVVNPGMALKPHHPFSDSARSEMARGTLTRSASTFNRREHKRLAVSCSAQRGQTTVETGAPEAQSSYYEVLGIYMDTNSVEVKKAYAGLAKQYHPDVTGGDPASTEYFYLIRDAYEVLSDETSRKQYNQQLLLSGYRPKTAPGAVPKGQELGMSKFEFYIVVILVNIPAFLFLWAPLFGVNPVDFITNLMGAK